VEFIYDITQRHKDHREKKKSFYASLCSLWLCVNFFMISHLEHCRMGLQTPSGRVTLNFPPNKAMG